MSIRLTVQGVTLELYDGLQWADEYTWSPVAMSTAHSTDGALLIDEAVRQAGRPITLEMPPGAGWATTRGQVDVLHAWASRAEEVLTLHIRGRDFSVMFNHESGTGFTATLMHPLFDSAIEAQAEYATTYRFIEI